METTYNFISITSARNLPRLRRDGKRPDIATLWRWWARGIRSVKLETWLIGGRRVTTEVAINEFLDRLSAGQSTAAPSLNYRHREIAAAQTRLAAAGI